MDLGLQNKRILITGGSQGVGRAIALMLAGQKARVAVIARNEANLKQVMREMGGPGNGHVYVACDLTQAGAIGQCRQKVNKMLGTPDIIINNIGDTLGITDPYCCLADWHRVFRINFGIAVEFNNWGIPFMKKKRWGRIVHIASNGSMENSGPVTYCTAKAALATYAQSLGRILAPWGIAVSTISPGALIAKGGYWEKMLLQRPEHVGKYIADRLPLRRFGSPEEVGNIVTFLCSRQAAAFSGDNLGVDGGQSKHFFGLY